MKKITGKTDISVDQSDHNLAILAATAMEMIKLPLETDFHQYITDKVHELTGSGSIIVFTEFDQSASKYFIRAFSGLKGHFKQIKKIIGGEIKQFSGTVNRFYFKKYKKGTFSRLTDGIYQLAGGSLSKTAAGLLIKLLSIDDVYTMGLTRGGKLFGNLSILFRKNSSKPNFLLIEAFVNLAVVALERKKTEEELHYSKQRMSSLIKHTSDAIFCYEYSPPIPINKPIKKQIEMLYDGILVECNDICARSYGADSADQVIGKELTENFGTKPGSLDQLHRAFIKHGYKTIDAEGIETLEDGSKRYYLNNAQGIIENGQLVRVWGTFRDVTNQKYIEGELRKEKEFTEAALNAQVDTLFVFEPKSGKAIRWNNAFSTISGYSGDEIEQLKAPDTYYSAEDMNKAAATIDKLLEGGEGTVELSLITKSGERIPTEYKSSVIRDEQGNPKYIIAVGRDIRARLLAEKALVESQERFRSIVHDQTEMIVRWKPGGLRTFVNDAYCSAFNARAEDLIGTSFFDLITDKDLKKVKNRIKSLSPSNSVSTDEHQVKLPDGSVGWQEWTDRAFFDENGAAIEYQSVGHDITKRKEAEDKIQTYQKNLRTLTSEVTLAEEKERRRIAVDLHDHLSQSLALAKITISQISKNDVPAALRTELAETRIYIDQAIDNSRSLTYDLSPPVLYELGLSAAIQWQLEQLESKHNLKTRYTTNVGSFNLDNDLRILLFRSVNEILNNVIKHAAATEVSVVVNSNHQRIKIQIKDNGNGFEVQQLNRRISREVGFGLFSIRERLDYVDGRIDVKSKPTKGTEVIIRVPIGK